MDDRIKFVIGQKKRMLNEISSRIAKFKLDGKDLGDFVNVKQDGSLFVPKEFADEDMPVLQNEYSKLSKKEKKVYDDHYHQSTTYLIQCYNESNKKYKDLFDTLDVYDKLDVLNFQTNDLQTEQKRANSYLATLSRQSEERKQNELNAE